MLTLLVYLFITICFGLESGIYGNAGQDYVSGNNALALYDPKTGNVTTITKAPTDVNSGTEFDLAIFDIHNEIYWYYTEIINYTTEAKLSVLGGYSLLNPNEDKYIAPLSFCSAESFIGAGLSFDYNSNDGNIYIWCPDEANNSTQNLLKLSWNKNRNRFDNVTINTMRNELNAPGYPLFSVIDSKRDYLWVSDPAGAEFMYYIDLKTGNITNRLSIIDWKSIAPIYSKSRDKIISSTTNINLQKVIQGMNITFADPETGIIDENKTVFVANLNEYNYVQEFYPPVYTMNDNDGIWYQLMWNFVSYDSYTIDLISIDIENGELLNKPVQICTFGQELETCPKSIIYLTQT